MFLPPNKKYWEYVGIQRDFTDTLLKMGHQYGLCVEKNGDIRVYVYFWDLNHSSVKVKLSFPFMDTSLQAVVGV